MWRMKTTIRWAKFGLEPLASERAMTMVSIFREACDLLSAGDLPGASEALASTCAPLVLPTKRTPWARMRLVRIFVRDGFTDRYFGEPLIFPGTLRALSVLAPAVFPYHRNWKQSLTHPAYWTHYPTIDHVVPVARGGEDNESNIVTTSMVRNAAKSNWLLSELGWPVERAPVAGAWDGLLPWFCAAFESNERLRQEPSLQQWYRAARDAR